MAKLKTHSLAPWLAVLLATGCTAAPSQETANLRNETALRPPSLGTSTLISDKGGAIVSDKGAGLVSNNAAGLIANNAGALTGVITGPGDRVLADAHQLIANSGASLVSPSGATLVSNGAAGLRVLALSDTAVGAGARVTVIDEQGRPLGDREVVADAQGRYTLDQLPATGPVIFVRATYERGGRTITMLTAAAAPRLAGTHQAPIDTASTLVGQKVASLLRSGELRPEAIEATELRELSETLAYSLSDADAAVAALARAEDAAEAFDRHAGEDAALRGALATLADTGGEAAVKTLAGSGEAGFADGAPGQARFNYPYAVAGDAAGTLYVADYRNHRIRKVAPDGTVSTLAGDGTAGFADGAGARAQFSSPRGVAVDPQGNVIVVDTGNGRIRKITPDGTVTTVAGGEAGYAEGVGAEARFNDPRGVAVDAKGTIYVADTGNHRIRKIAAGGAVSTHAVLPTPEEAAQPEEAKLNGPYGLAADGLGRLFVADTTQNRILVVDAEGEVEPFAGSGAWGGADGAGAEASFRSPVALAIDATGQLYVADCFSHTIRKVASDGRVSTVAGTGAPGATDGSVDAARFFGPYGLAIAGGRLVVADTSNHSLRSVQLP